MPTGSLLARIDEYAAQAKASWGKTPEYKEYEEKSKGRTGEENAMLSQQMMDIFYPYGIYIQKCQMGK